MIGRLRHLESDKEMEALEGAESRDASHIRVMQLFNKAVDRDGRK